jgi:hypothetical protein
MGGMTKIWKDSKSSIAVTDDPEGKKKYKP